jgi:hypothetical protein
LRNDDFDLVYLAEGDKKVGVSPTKHECGGDNKGKEAAITDTTVCTNDKTLRPSRCCAVNVAAQGEAAKIYCVTTKYWYTSAANASNGLRFEKTIPDANVITCAGDETAPVSTPACGKNGAGANADECNAGSTKDARCCYVSYPTYDQNANVERGICFQSAKGKRSESVADIKTKVFTPTDPVCGTDTTAPTGKECGVENPTKVDDCFASLDKSKGRCCFNTVGGKSNCIASGKDRNVAPAVAAAALYEKYDIGLDALSCEGKTDALPDKNTCGKGEKVKKDSTDDAKKEDCTKDSNVCCLATSIDGKKNRCIGNEKKPDSKGVNRTNYAPTIAAAYGDLSAIDCSSTFVSASVAFFAVVLALF